VHLAILRQISLYKGLTALHDSDLMLVRETRPCMRSTDEYSFSLDFILVGSLQQNLVDGRGYDVEDVWEEDPRDQLSTDCPSKADGSGTHTSLHRRGVESRLAPLLPIDFAFFVSEKMRSLKFSIRRGLLAYA
jgi:hypothetical protein